MHSLLDHVEIKGRVLDACGSTGDALGLILAERGTPKITYELRFRYTSYSRRARLKTGNEQLNSRQLRRGTAVIRSEERTWDEMSRDRQNSLGIQMACAGLTLTVRCFLCCVDFYVRSTADARMDATSV